MTEGVTVRVIVSDLVVLLMVSVKVKVGVTTGVGETTGVMTGVGVANRMDESVISTVSGNNPVTESPSG